MFKRFIQIVIDNLGKVNFNTYVSVENLCCIKKKEHKE